MDLLLEAVESITLACTLAVLVPGLGLTLAAGPQAPIGAGGYIAGVGVWSWVRFGGWIGAPDAVRSHLFFALVLGLAAFVIWRRLDARVAVVGAFAFGGVVSLYWRPCVGLEFAEILNAISDSPSALPKHLVFVTVLLLPIIVLAALPEGVAALQRYRDHRVTSGIGLAVCATLVVMVAVGWFDDLMGELFRISSG